MAQILIAGKDWTARALLRAQLIEEGFDVEAYEDVTEVADRLWGSAEMPALLIVDIFGNTNSAEDIATLSPWAKQLPIWMLVGKGTTGASELAGQGFERVLFRPINVGTLVQEVKERLAG
jgi:DNA-binding response OmpR family regulator